MNIFLIIDSIQVVVGGRVKVSIVFKVIEFVNMSN